MNVPFLLPAPVWGSSSSPWTAHCCLLSVAPNFHVAARRIFLTHKPELVTFLLKNSPYYPFPCFLCCPSQATDPLLPIPASLEPLLLASSCLSFPNPSGLSSSLPSSRKPSLPCTPSSELSCPGSQTLGHLLSVLLAPCFHHSVTPYGFPSEL